MLQIQPVCVSERDLNAHAQDTSLHQILDDFLIGFSLCTIQELEGDSEHGKGKGHIPDHFKATRNNCTHPYFAMTPHYAFG